MTKNYFCLLILVLVLGGCDMFETSCYDANISGDTYINIKNITRISSVCEDKDTICFAVISDTQGWYDETEEIVAQLNKRTDVDFVIHAGDIADFGATKEYLWQRDILNKLKAPYVVVIGNHDCLGDGEQVFTTVFGKKNFAFTAGKVRFVCLNTNALEYDYSEPVPDFDFMEEQMADSALYEKTIIVMHAPPYSEQFDNNVAKIFEKDVLAFKHSLFCVHGHNHHLQKRNLYEDGMIYYGCDCAKNKCYLVFTVYPDNHYNYEAVYF